MATQAQFTALGAALDADVTAVQNKVGGLQAQIADLQAQIAVLNAQLASQMTAAEEDATLLQFQAIADRVHAMLP